MPSGTGPKPGPGFVRLGIVGAARAGVRARRLGTHDQREEDPAQQDERSHGGREPHPGGGQREGAQQGDAEDHADAEQGQPHGGREWVNASTRGRLRIPKLARCVATGITSTIIDAVTAPRAPAYSARWVPSACWKTGVKPTEKRKPKETCPRSG